MITDLRRRSALLIFVVMFVGMQFIRPDLRALPADPARSIFARLSPPAEVEALLMTSCNDCHGFAQRWPWYSRVAPVSWLIGSDVEEAQSRVDFTEWGGMEPARQAAALERMCAEARAGEMPLPRYVWMHRAAALAPEQVSALCEWAAAEAAKLKGSGLATAPLPGGKD